MNNKFTDKELSDLCRLYLEGRLSRQEERMLFYILNNTEDLNEEGKRIKGLMMAEKSIFFSYKGQRRKRRIYYSGIAAAVIAICAIAIPVFMSHYSVEDTYVVWQDGERITGDKAKEMAEASQQEDMEMIRNVMRQHREMMKRNFASVNMDDFDY